MIPRDLNEAERVATPLELLVDLAFVVAVAQASAAFHHKLDNGHVGAAVGLFLVAFFAIWWAWINFTWFASAYDTDDALYRLATFVQITGVLILAAGVPRAFDHADLRVLTAGYAVMRVAMIGQWLRAAYSDTAGRTTALRYAIGIFIAQLGWVGRLWLAGPVSTASVLLLIIVELAVPIWAESATPTAWHPGHIADRYGGFTIIVLGESVLSATIGVQSALDAQHPVTDLIPVLAGGLLILFSLWWLYFSVPGQTATERAREGLADSIKAAFIWGYGHYLIFASAALTGAGLAFVISATTESPGSSQIRSTLAVTIPVAIYVVMLWALHLRHSNQSPLESVGPPVAGVLIVLSSFGPEPILVTGIICASLVAFQGFTRARVSPST